MRNISTKKIGKSIITKKQGKLGNKQQAVPLLGVVLAAVVTITLLVVVYNIRRATTEFRSDASGGSLNRLKCSVQSAYVCRGQYVGEQVNPGAGTELRYTCYQKDGAEVVDNYVECYAVKSNKTLNPFRVDKATDLPKKGKDDSEVKKSTQKDLTKKDEEIKKKSNKK